MKAKDIARNYRIDRKEFEEFVKYEGVNFTTTFIGEMVIDDFDVHNLVETFQETRAERQQNKQEEIRNKEQAIDDKRIAMATMLITSGFTFDGYTITKYSGYISGDDVFQTPRTKGFFGTNTNVGQALTDALVTIRRNALNELKEAAYALGCNAVIGVDFDYITMDPHYGDFNGRTIYQPYIFCVTANGNAVVIEKN